MPFPVSCCPKANTTLQGAGFDPLSISSMTEWFDYRTLASVGDGNPISSWAGSKGLYTLTNTGTARPTYIASDTADAKPAVSFNGVNQALKSDISNSDLYGSGGDHEIWFRFKTLNPQTITGGLFSSNGITNGMGCHIKSTNVYFTVSNAGIFSSSVSLWDGVWHTVRFVRSGGVAKLYVDGINYYNAADPGSYNVGADILNLGGAYDAYYMLGGIRHGMFFNASLDDATASKLNTYLQAA